MKSQNIKRERESEKKTKRNRMIKTEIKEREKYERLYVNEQETE